MAIQNHARPRVSIILPVYNAAPYISASVTRLLSQSYRDFEIVVVDDKSTDDTLAKLREFRHDPRIELIPLAENGGVANARNVAVQRSRGQFVWFVDADDLWSDDFLATMVAAADESGADVVVCSARFVFGEGLSKSEFVVEYARAESLSGLDGTERLLLGTGALWNKLFRKETLGTSPFPALRSKSDHAGLLGVLPAVTRVATVPESLYTYVQRAGSISNGGVAQPKNFLALLPIAERSLAQLGSSRRVHRLSAQFRCIVVSRALRETWRFTETDDRAATAELSRYVTWSDIAKVPRGDRRTLLPLVAAKTAPGTARRLFRRMGRARWATQGGAA